jgi:hypothetical protein
MTVIEMEMGVYVDAVTGEIMQEDLFRDRGFLEEIY